MSTKKKLWISIGALCVAIVAGLGITFGVLAAQTQKVNTGFEVEYKATNVTATVSASYKSKNGTKVDFKDGNNTSVSFVASDETKTGSLSADKCTLTATDNYVVYEYVFKNDNATGGRSMTVAMADTSEKENVTVTYASSETQITDASTITATAYETQTVAAQGTVYVYIKIAIAEDTLDASYVSTSTNGVAWTLNCVTGA